MIKKVIIWTIAILSFTFLYWIEYGDINSLIQLLVISGLILIIWKNKHRLKIKRKYLKYLVALLIYERVLTFIFLLGVSAYQFYETGVFRPRGFFSFLWIIFFSNIYSKNYYLKKDNWFFKPINKITNILYKKNRV